MAHALKSNYEDRRRDLINRDINEAKDCFVHAIQNLDLSDESNEDLERSVLDFAIFISLNVLELSLYERHINGKDMPISKKEADDVQKGNWDKFVTNTRAKKYLKMIK